ncbi:MAG TPA: acyl carrier protein [Verrucomicrobiae bacterium]|nr:acyl carrier protein [Verrucomicrobiae bacterium]
MNYANQIREYIIQNFLFGDRQALKDDSSFLDSGIVDSTGMLEFIMFLETTFHIKIEPEEMVPDNLDSVDRVVQFLNRKLSPATA